ncbi:hypothetical protein LguiB_013871 [Lonicera macranthoides]
MWWGWERKGKGLKKEGGDSNGGGGKKGWWSEMVAGDQDNVFDVFRASALFPGCSPGADDTPRCYWSVKHDVFYYSNEMADPDSLDWKKIKKEIHIVNGLPDNTYSLVFRCQSKDDDLGEHQLLVGQEYYWKFHVNFFKTTLFFCHFYWGDQDNVFDVFRASTPFPDCSPAADDTPRCYWKKNTSKNNGIRVIALCKYRKKMYITCDLKKNKVLVAFYHPLCIKREATTWPAPVHGCRWLSIILTTPEIDLKSTKSTTRLSLIKRFA